MLDTANVKALGQQDLKNWAKQIFAQKLVELTQSQQIAHTSASGPDAADHRLWDETAVRAWNLIEADGITAKWPTHLAHDCVLMSAAEADAGQRMLTILTDSLKAPMMAAKLSKSFEAATGQSAQAAQHVVQLMQTYILAMAHAHRSVPDLEAGRAAGFRDMLDAMRSEMIAAETCAFSTQTENPVSALHNATMKTEEIATPKDSQMASHGESAAAVKTPDTALTAVVGRLMEDKKADNLRTGTVTQYGSCIELFIKITGITDVRDVTQTAVSAFRDGLRRISNSYGKSLADNDLTYNQLLQKATGLPQDRVGLSATTVNRHLDHIRQVHDKADSEGIVLPHKINTSKLRLKERKRDRDKRAVFRAAELEKVFQHTLWTGSVSAARRHETGSVITKDGQYWCPLIASVTGARLEEIAALTVSDIRIEDCIPHFSFDENEIRDGLCCANQLTNGSPLSPDGFIPRLL